MTNLHRTGDASVGSHGRPPADGGQQPEGIDVPAVGTETQEGPHALSGAAPVARQTTRNDWRIQVPISALPPCRPVCSFPESSGEAVNWRCPECNWSYRFNPIVERWYVS